MDKIKVLSVGECSYINSGYGMYNNGLLRELHKNPNLHIQEFGLFFNPINNKSNTIDWDFYPNILPEHAIMDSDEKFNSWKEWANHTPNHMGGPLFEHILLESQPDVVIANNDAWHLRYLIDSPYRRFYKLVCLFACDSIPQSWTWIEDMKLCDAVLTYSEWGKREIEKQSPEIKVFGSAPPSCPHVFQPLDKNAVRANFGIAPDAKIIGTVMRNQIRKLFPSLFSLFARYLQDTNDKDTYLYVHSKYPDGSWCFPQLIQEYGIAHRVLFTYRCQVKECKHVFSSLYQDIAQCPKCSSFSGVMPGTMDGVSDEELCQIYNLFNLYIQYSNAEGYGLTQPEAAACGVPVVSVKYSAMEDMEKSIDAKMVNVLTYSRDLNTAQNRAIPDDNHALSIIKEFFSKPTSVRNIFGIRTRKAFEQYYSWGKTADTWTKAIESVYTGKVDWMAPPHVHEPAEKTDKYMTNVEYARWLIKDVGGLNYRLNSFYENQIIRNLNYGCRAEMITNGGGNSALEYNRDIAYNEFKRIAEVNKTKEIYRCKKLGLI